MNQGEKGEGMHLAGLLEYGAAVLHRVGVENPQLEACLLLEACLGVSRTEIYLHSRREVDPARADGYLAGIARREKREPLAYILTEREFWSLPFHVDPAVLIPRPETEFLLDRVLTLADPENFRRGTVVDLCCGSGVIGVVLALESTARVIATDISAAALRVARINSHRHQLGQRILLVQSDLFAAFAARPLFSLVVSNPPYVRGGELTGGDLAPEVIDHEPSLALDGGENGLAVITRIRHALPHMLCLGGQVFMEIGADQGPAVLELFRAGLSGEAAFEELAIHQDYAGRDRVFQARLAGSIK